MRQKVWGLGANTDGSNPFADLEPKVSANLTNQFEWPVLFYAVSIVLMVKPEYYQSIHLYFAWIFIIGRFIHSFIQILTNNIRLRGLIFTINFMAVVCMWFLLGLTMLTE